MATLASVRGADLAGQVGTILGQGFEAQNVRRRAAEEQADLESKIAAALGVGQAPPPQDAGALGRLGQLSPQLAQAVGQANPQEATDLRAQAQTGMDLATELQGLPDHAARLKRLAAEAGTQAAGGGDLNRLVELSNMDDAALGLELQRMQIIGQDTISLLPQRPSESETFAALMADNPAIGGSLLGRRDQQIAAERARQAAAANAAARARASAAAAAGPQGEFAKGLAAIEGNFAGGHITEADRDTRIANLRSEFASAPAAPAYDMYRDVNDQQRWKSGPNVGLLVNEDVTPAPAPGFRAATPEEASARGAPGGQFGPDNRFYPAPTPSGMAIEMTEGGGFTFTQGAGVGGAAVGMDEGATAATAKVAPDYERIVNEDDGTFRDVLIQGSPTWSATIDEAQQIEKGLDDFNQSNAIILEDLARAKTLIEESNIPITGFGALAGAVPGAPAFELKELLETSISTVALDRLIALKATGATMGALNESEGNMLRVSSGSLNRFNNEDALVRNIDRLINMRQGMGVRMESAYNQDYAQVGKTFGAETPSITISDIQSMNEGQMMDVTPIDMDSMTPEALAAFVEALRAASGGR